MSDLRPELPHDPDGAGVVRDAKIEELLLVGLDQYFAGQYEQAINVWTRVLFLDRGHARARAYIERARSAIAERARESEELLQSGIAAFERGDTDAARRMLDASVERGGPSDVALTLLSRLRHREPETGSPDLPRDPHAHVVPREQISTMEPSPPPGRSRAAFALGSVALLLVVGALGMMRGQWRWIGARGESPSARNAGAGTEPLRVPRAAEDAFARARTLYGRGHLNEALVALDQIRLADPLRPEADRLKAEIQRTLIEAAGAAARRQ